MRKKVYFSEIVFTNDYYINGINIFDENNIEFIDNIDLDLKLGFLKQFILLYLVYLLRL